MVKLFWLDRGLRLKGTLKLKDGREAGGTAYQTPGGLELVVLGVYGDEIQPNVGNIWLWIVLSGWTLAIHSLLLNSCWIKSISNTMSVCWKGETRVI